MAEFIYSVVMVVAECAGVCAGLILLACGVIYAMEVERASKEA